MGIFRKAKKTLLNLHFRNQGKEFPITELKEMLIVYKELSNTMEMGLIFMKRTLKEIEIIGREVFIDIYSKIVAVLDNSNLEMPLMDGVHKLKMYNTHTHETVIG